MNIHEKTTINDEVIEAGIIKKILVSKKMIPGLKSEFFTSLRKQLFDAIEGQLINHHDLDRYMLQDGYPQAYEQCINTESNSSEVAIDRLYKLWMIRETALKLCGCNLTEENVLSEIEQIQLQLSDITHKNDRSTYDHYKEAQKIMDYVQQGAASGKTLLGYSTGIQSVDLLSNGLEKGKAYALGALKKCGKSRFAVHLSCHLAKQGAKIYWNSLEMTREQLNLLALSYLSKINSNILGKNIYKRDLPKISLAYTPFNNLNWNLYKDKTVYDMKSRIRSLKEKPDIVIIDFIQKMQSDRYKGDRTREIENIAQDISDFTKEDNICTLTLSQLQGLAEKLDPEEVPNMSHFKESQGIPENMDQIWTLHNPNRHNSPYVNNEYVPENFLMRIEQRFDISGPVCEFKGDMRTCTFYDKTEEEKDDDKYRDFR